LRQPDYSEFLSKTARFIARLFGWRIEGQLPDAKKFVILGAPHTTNWDFALFLLVSLNFRIRFIVTLKDEWYRFPLKATLRWLGVLPINRRQRTNVVDTMIEEFAKHDQLAFLVTPEGTRQYTDYWKTGFYYIALGAGVPIVLGYGDYQRKVTGIGPTIMPSGDIDADMALIRDFYASITPKHPANAGPVRVRGTAES